MATKKVTYYCDTCNKPFSKEEKAVDCEKSHYKHKPRTKVQTQYSEGESLPTEIEVVLVNGYGNEITKKVSLKEVYNA